MCDSMIEALAQDELERLRDACNRRLLRIRQTKGLPLHELLRLLDGVKATLREQGKEWYSLERWRWDDGEIRFWLNPIDHTCYQMGWFGIDDLIAWTEDLGPIAIDPLSDVVSDAYAQEALP